MRKPNLTLLAASIVALTAAPAAARENSMVVSFADLDLTTPAGAAELDQRIETAAEQVCAKPHMFNRREMGAWEECKVATIAHAEEQLADIEPQYQNLARANAF